MGGLSSTAALGGTPKPGFALSVVIPAGTNERGAL
jgi:hypothetical protein